MNSNIATQEMFADTAQGSQEIAQSHPHSLDGIGINLEDAGPVVIACPFLLCMGHCRARMVNRV